MSARNFITELCALAGITIDGSAPHDLKVRDERFFARVARDGSLGLGESYMEGWWDTGDLVELHGRIAATDLAERVRGNARILLNALVARWFNLQRPSRARIVAEQHYDRTVDVYRKMTDPWITLSCGYWRRAVNLTQAQEDKLDLMCRKIGLNDSHHVLDVGCGFGSFVRFAAQHYGCRVTGINISTEQIAAARQLAAGLPVEFVLCDYRELATRFGEECFDHAVSAGMFEHVGVHNFHRYMSEVHHVLKPGGLFLLHTVGSNVSVHENDPWCDRYIYPNGMLPSIAQIGSAIEKFFTMEDWHNFGYDYFHTLKAWYDNLDSAWEGSRDDPYYRMWKYFLLCCAGQFRARRLQLWQIVLAKPGDYKPYHSIR